MFTGRFFILVSGMNNVDKGCECGDKVIDGLL